MKKWKAGEKAFYLDIVALIDQLDEPEKPVVPQFVAEWVEENKKYGLYDTFNVLYSDDYKETAKWLHGNDYETNRERENIVARAWLNGYTVEEDRYYVLSTEKRMMLVRKMDGKTITQADPFPLTELHDAEKKAHALTEKEIKDYDPRYLAFAIPVEELEE